MGKSGAINMKYEFLKPIFARPGLLPCHSEKLAMGDKCGSDCAYVHPDPQTVLSVLQYEVEPMGRFAHLQFRSSKWRKKRNLERIIKAYMNSNVQRSSAGSLLQNNCQTIPIVPKNNHGPLFGSKCQGSSVGNVSSSADFLYQKAADSTSFRTKAASIISSKSPGQKRRAGGNSRCANVHIKSQALQKEHIAERCRKLEAVVN
jgi:hypothetical protein